MPPTATHCPTECLDPPSPAMGADCGSPWDTQWAGRVEPKGLCSGDWAFLVGSATDQLVATGRRGLGQTLKTQSPPRGNTPGKKRSW